MERTSYSKLSQRDVDRAETDLLINLSAITQRGLAKMIGCHESKISRTDWRFIASVLCAFGMASDISPINPPYSNIRPWVEKAAEQCIQQRQTVVMLVPEDMSVGWFSKALESVDEVRIITDGRINFIEPSTGLEKKGNSKGSMLLIWRPFISPRRMFTTVSKAALMAIGQGVRRAA
ncbi:phage N-6-adenine-methyltransferase [Escherichia coli]|nr:phage N-6-adenine-methyltransferase [Escherichia coli]HAJ7005335.1 phage N-6-adenine-methyltransferase [Escherichia coli]